MNTAINEHNLRELAYRIWEEEGRPPGQAERHWQMAMEKTNLEQGSFTTGENFLGETITSDNVVGDERQYALQNNPFAEEGANTQQLQGSQPAKGGKRKSSKNKDDETLASQDASAPTRKSGKRKSSDNILV